MKAILLIGLVLTACGGTAELAGQSAKKDAEAKAKKEKSHVESSDEPKSGKDARDDTGELGAGAGAGAGGSGGGEIGSASGSEGGGAIGADGTNGLGGPGDDSADSLAGTGGAGADGRNQPGAGGSVTTSNGESMVTGGHAATDVEIISAESATPQPQAPAPAAAALPKCEICGVWTYGDEFNFSQSADGSISGTNYIPGSPELFQGTMSFPNVTTFPSSLRVSMPGKSRFPTFFCDGVYYLDFVFTSATAGNYTISTQSISSLCTGNPYPTPHGPIAMSKK